MRSQGEKCAHNFLAPPAKIGGAGGWLKGQRKHSQKKAAGRQRRTASAGSDSDQARAPPPKGARKPEGRRPAKPREKRAAIAGPRRGGPGPGERRESTSERAAERDTGARSEKKARAAKPGVALTLVLLLSEVLRRWGAGPKRLRAPRGAKAEREAAAKPPRPQWGLGLLARLRERPIAPQERICRRLVSDGATGGRGPPAGDSQGARPEHGRVHQEIHAKKEPRIYTSVFSCYHCYCHTTG